MSQKELEAKSEFVKTWQSSKDAAGDFVGA